MATIFVSIASYRDSSCSKTLESLYANAENPERVFVGICEQNKKETESTEKCTSPETSQYNCNIRTINLDYTEAKGPTWARYLCSTLYNGEDYFMQVDSHVLFSEGWDTKCIRMIKGIQETTDSKYPLLSHYTRNYGDFGKPNENNNVPKMCQSFFNGRGMISFLGSEVRSIGKEEYHKNPYIAAGFIFTLGSFIHDVPFDPSLDYVFVGEEILLSARAFTAGYDTYGPTEDICYHYYTRKNEPKIWTDKKYKDTEAHERIKVMMRLKDGNANPGRYGMGTKRTLQEYYDFAGIDIKNKKITKNFCKDEVNPYSELPAMTMTKPFYDIALSVLVIMALGLLVYYKGIRLLEYQSVQD